MPNVIINRFLLLAAPAILRIPLLLVFFYALVLAPAYAAVMVIDKQWPQNTSLKVVFLDCSKDQQRLVEQVAPQWLAKSNLSFQFYDSFEKAPKETHIRISFLVHSGSRLGNHRDYCSDKATMNLFDLTTGQLSDSSARRLILHEFGHALGLVHEFRSPYWPYGTNVLQKMLPNCYPKMERIGYSKQGAILRCKAVNRPVDPKKSEKTAFDEFSVMNYPTIFTTQDGSKKTISAQSRLSYLDRYAIQLWYPGRAVPYICGSTPSLKQTNRRIK